METHRARAVHAGGRRLKTTHATRVGWLPRRPPWSAGTAGSCQRGCGDGGLKALGSGRVTGSRAGSGARLLPPWPRGAPERRVAGTAAFAADKHCSPSASFLAPRGEAAAAAAFDPSPERQRAPAPHIGKNSQREEEKPCRGEPERQPPVIVESLPSAAAKEARENPNKYSPVLPQARTPINFFELS